MAEEAKWYVVHTYSGYENKVKANIEKSVENRGIQDLITDVRVPVEESRKRAMWKRLFSAKFSRAMSWSRWL